ncbi:sugar nucleotide-binding protein, partial [Streptomyces sp. T-3]|nr:sugar nucleotide-binding protein [Streptomyces sp. T-3]
EPMPSSELDRPAERPAFSVLAHGRWATAGLAPPRPWDTALAEALPLLVGSPDRPAPQPKETTSSCAA